MNAARFTRQSLPALALLLVATAPAWAQGLFRIVGPDGRVTYSDRPPPEASANVTPMTPGFSPRRPDNTPAAWPEELRQAAARYPVTLYTTPGCEPCGSGRDLLRRRGVPFTEKTVSTPTDIQALQRLAGTQSLPVLTIGGQQLKGYSEGEWVQYLDLAAYPKTSQLPAGYRPPEPTPLAPPLPAPSTAAEDAARAATPALPPPLPAPALPAPTPGNPTGIRF